MQLILTGLHVVLILISLMFVKYSSPIGLNLGLLWKKRARYLPIRKFALIDCLYVTVTQ